MNDPEKFIRCFDAKMNPNSENHCIGGTLWNCKQCPYDVPYPKWKEFLYSGRQYALQITEQRIFRKEKA